LKEFWRKWYKEEQRRDRKLIRALQSLGIYEQNDFESIRDEVDKIVKQSEIARTIRANPEIAESYTKRDQGIKSSAVIEQWYDHGTSQDDINKAIERVARRANKSSRKERLARKFITHCISRGYYGYLLLRKWLGCPLEHIVLRPWYADYLPHVAELINPGGEVTLLEGTYKITDPVNLVSNISFRGVGAATVLELNAAFYTADKAVVEGLNVSNCIVRDMSFDVSGYDSVAAIRYKATTGPQENVAVSRCRIIGTNTEKYPNVAIAVNLGGSEEISNIFVDHCIIDGGNYGIYIGTGDDTQLEKTINAHVESNIIKTYITNPIALYYGTKHAYVIGNNILGGGHGGIALSYATFTSVVGNSVRNITTSDEGGIEIEDKHGNSPSHHNLVVGNTVTSCNWGIYIRKEGTAAQGGNDNVIVGNTVQGCSIGIYIETADNNDNLIVANNARDNTTPITDNGTGTLVANNKT